MCTKHSLSDFSLFQFFSFRLFGRSIKRDSSSLPPEHTPPPPPHLAESLSLSLSHFLALSVSFPSSGNKSSRLSIAIYAKYDKRYSRGRITRYALEYFIAIIMIIDL